MTSERPRHRLARRTVFKAAALGGLLATPALAAATAPREGGPLPDEAAMAVAGAAFHPERLPHLRDMLARHVESGFVPGLVAAIWRKGELHLETLGHQAFGGAPMRRDSIFRGASITKPVTAAAAMILVEEGRLRLDDPVDPFLPELSGRKVLRSIASGLDDTVPANRPITLRDLLTQRFGLGAIMVWPPRHPIQHAMAEAGVAPGFELPALDNDAYMAALGALPLAAQPGEEWLYNNGLDVAGILIARASGQSLGDFMRERMFAPLGMKDTGFFVPAAKRDRLVTLYRNDHATERLIVHDDPGSRFSRPPVFESGAGGLVTTADDYLDFQRMLLAGGSLDGKRILSRASVALMTTDQLSPAQKAGPHAAMFFNGNSGWGLGMAVALARDNLWMNPGRFGWDGGYGTSAYADAAEGLAGILLTQRMMDSPAPPPTYTDFWTGAYQAIV